MANDTALLSKARADKKDEFYTQYMDIEAEMRNYTEQFAGKTVLCNCDDPRVSNFFRYFAKNFKRLQLKRLICTCYKNQNADLFSQKALEPSVYIDFDGNNVDLDNIDEADLNILPLKGDGDFRSKECIELLKQADIVCTNPPFSLFREYVAQLMKYDKKFIILGNMNAVTYKDCFQYMMDNKMWIGESIHSGDREFEVPQDYPLEAAGCRVAADGRRYIRVKGVRWFTNMEYKDRKDKLELTKTYNPNVYPHYDQYDAINVNKSNDIPNDYEGVMGVPITFLDKYNPEQFKILGLDRYVKDNPKYGHRFTINKKETYARILIKKI